MRQSNNLRYVQSLRFQDIKGNTATITVLPRLEDTLVNQLKRDIANKFNFILVITGKRTGIGKSDYAMQLGLQLDPNPNTLIERILFDIEKFFDMVEELPPGSVIILDESGVQLDNAMWMSLFSRMFKYCSETFRLKRLIVIFCLPNVNMLDPNQRRLLNGLLHVFHRGRAGFEEVITYPNGVVTPQPRRLVDAQPIPEDHPLKIAYEEKKSMYFRLLIRRIKIEIKMKGGFGSSMYSESVLKALEKQLHINTIENEFNNGEESGEEEEEEEELEEAGFSKTDKVPPWERHR